MLYPLQRLPWDVVSVPVEVPVPGLGPGLGSGLFPALGI